MRAAGGKVEGVLGQMGSRLKGVGQTMGKSPERAADIIAEMDQLKARVEELSKKLETLQPKQ